MLCTNGHTCPNNATYCSTCGANTFDRSTINQFGQIARPTNGLAIAALVLGIVWVYWIGSILALIFGLMARKQIRETGASGEGMAIAGIVLGIVGIVTLILFVVFAVSLGHTNFHFVPTSTIA